MKDYIKDTKLRFCPIVYFLGLKDLNSLYTMSKNAKKVNILKCASKKKIICVYTTCVKSANFDYFRRVYKNDQN